MLNVGRDALSDPLVWPGMVKVFLVLSLCWLRGTQIVTLGSEPGINTRYQAALYALYGPVAIRETCGGATE